MTADSQPPAAGDPRSSRSAGVREILAKAGPPPKAPVALEELRVVRGRTWGRLLLALVVVIVMASRAVPSRRSLQVPG